MHLPHVFDKELVLEDPAYSDGLAEGLCLSSLRGTWPHQQHSQYPGLHVPLDMELPLCLQVVTTRVFDIWRGREGPARSDGCSAGNFGLRSLCFRV